MTLIDTHAHLYWESFQEDLDAIIQRSISAGVTTIINVGVDVKLSKIALQQVQGKLASIPGFKAYSTIGIHPHESVNYPTDVSIHKDIEELEKLYQSLLDQIVAVGECGLDFNSLSDLSQKAVQIKLLRAQIELAKKLDLPLLIHCRNDRSTNPENSEAWDQILDIIDTHPTILHCYSGLAKTTQKVLASPTLFVSFAGTLTYPKNDYLREAVKLMPLDRLVLETDSPFLPPQSIRGQRNEPASVLEIAKLIAEIKGVSLDDAANKTTETAQKILRIK